MMRLALATLPERMSPARWSRPLRGPASRSARGSDRSSESWLDDLPPLSIPRDEARNELPEPRRPASELSERKPTSQPEVQAAVETPVPAAAALAPTTDASTSPATPRPRSASRRAFSGSWLSNPSFLGEPADGRRARLACREGIQDDSRPARRRVRFSLPLSGRCRTEGCVMWLCRLV